MKRLTLSALLTLTALACGSDDDRGDPTGGFGGGLGADGGTSGTGGTGAGGTGDGTCQAKAVNSGRIAPDILIVLDRSGSMKSDGRQGPVANRWDPSVTGIKTITTSLQDRVSFGLMTFPALGGGECAPGTVNVESAPNNAGAIAQVLDDRRTQPSGRTPTSMSLAAARAAFAANQAPDAPLTPKYILLVTDGAPNCLNNAPSTITGNGQPLAVDATVTEIQALTKAGVKTYVLGFDTQNTADLKAALDRMAAEGGTGDTVHRPIENEQGLIDQFKAITDVAISCEFVLESAVQDATRVRVEIDGQKVNLNDKNGFKVAADKKTITLQGDACTTMKKEGHTLSISVQCTSQVPI